MDNAISRGNYETLDDLMGKVNNTAATMEEGCVRRAVDSLHHRVSYYVKKNYEHFEANL